MGLLLSHKRKARLSVYNDMASFSLVGDVEHRGGGKRGEIENFSKQSRIRLFKLLHQLKFKRITFVTLTYPAVFPDDVRESKAHLKEYRRRFEILYGKIQTVWRLEFQERGAPHYHLMLLDAPFIPIEDWREIWYNVVGSGDENHRLIGTDVRLVTGSDSPALVASYLGKYLGKVDQSSGDLQKRNVGRFWGSWNIEIPEPIEIILEDWQMERVIDVLLGSRGDDSTWEPASREFFSLFGSSMGSTDFSRYVIGVAAKIARETTLRHG